MERQIGGFKDMKTYVLCSLEDMIDLAQYVQSMVYWGWSFRIKDDDTLIKWREFWDILKSEVEENRCKRVAIDEKNHEVEFII